VQVRVSTRHGHLSDTSQAKIASKAEKLLRIFDRLMEIEVVVDLSDDHQPRVDVNVTAEHKHDFVAHVQNHELMVAVDLAIEKVEHQLRKYKEKVVERHRDRDREVRDVEAEFTVDNEQVEADNE
jgi:putative sigma-54 modulation protein